MNCRAADPDRKGRITTSLPPCCATTAAKSSSSAGRRRVCWAGCGPSPADAWRRRTPLEVALQPGVAPAPVQHGFTHFRITLHARECRLLGGPHAAPEVEIAWVRPADLAHFSFGGAERALIAAWLTGAARTDATR